MNHTPGLILVIDDDVGMCRLARALFEDEGYAVITSQDATSTLAEITAPDGPRPDLILLDLRMPVMDGPTFAREYLARTPSPAPIVLLSGDVRPLAEDLPWAADCLPKPFDLDRLLTVVRTHLRDR
jgi:DNA-binding response OmpR family regulator